MTVYCIYLENFEGESTFNLFRNKEKAYKCYCELRKKAMNKEEFYDEEEFDINEEWNQFSFFDPSYNENSTYVTIREKNLEDFFYDDLY